MTARLADFATAGVETVTVPAGAIPAYRLELSGMQLPVVMHVSQQSPRRVIRVAPTGAPLVFELVREGVALDEPTFRAWASVC